MINNDYFSNDDPPTDGVPSLRARANFRPSGDFSKKKISPTIIRPEAARAFSEAELEIIHSLPYGKSGKVLKPSNRSRGIGLNHVLYTITLMEVNGGLTKKGCMMGVHQLGKILGEAAGKKGSADTPQHVLECLMTGGIISPKKHYDPKAQKARSYTISLSFRAADKVHELRGRMAANRSLNAEIEALLEEKTFPWEN